MTQITKAILEGVPRYDGVPRINVYLLRLLYILMFFVLGKETWTHILTHQVRGIPPMPWSGASGPLLPISRALAFSVR